ncbi:hypothetical protein F9U64_19545 [Gracilibacillus oryzae]|uniref:5,10-methylene-tetrahydrofolate dehydrogenase n=1 Tax=Gracilibacillus oryzae TaxID=1672701 RepID=A0A7C8KSH4_9BACI|nr:hypothetical protein [Gracilibacillus oryzae]KAB8126645.1 hypothetical protein F9U64_19545 [Gracilibacillus oryzae]
MHTGSTKRIGIITAPGYTEQFGEVLKEKLPHLFSDFLDNQIDWKVEYQIDPLTGVTEDEGKIKNAISEIMEEKDWDIAICLTDLPFFHKKSPIVIEIDKMMNIAWLSVPSLGILPVTNKVVNSVVSIVRDLVAFSYSSEKKLKTTVSSNIEKLKYLSPVKRDEIDNSEKHEVFYTYRNKFFGFFKLLFGMIKANQPWVIFPHFLKIVVIAFTSGCFALVFPALWGLSDSYNVGRLILVTVISISMMVTWILLVHKLWEKPQEGRSKSFRRLYNLTTVVTLLITVCFYYLILFVAFIFASITLIPGELLQKNISTEVNVLSYLTVAWTATCISTLIGAFGTTLENEEAVLSTTYGNRQRQRYKKIKKLEAEKEAEKETEENDK